MRKVYVVHYCGGSQSDIVAVFAEDFLANEFVGKRRDLNIVEMELLYAVDQKMLSTNYGC